MFGIHPLRAIRRTLRTGPRKLAATVATLAVLGGGGATAGVDYRQIGHDAGGFVASFVDGLKGSDTYAK